MSSFPIECLDLIDAEFDGKSWNAAPLMATLDKLSAAEAASVDTWEGYSAWSVGLHCATCKRLIAVDLLVADLGVAVPAWPYPEKELFPQPSAVTEEAWAADKALIRACHEACMRGLRSASDSVLDGQMPSWDAPWRKVIAWLMTHDAFHGAQIRSMGLPSLREPREASS